MKEKLIQAIEYATKLHAKQFRKNSIEGVELPYITHPMEVMKLVWTWGVGDYDLLIVAILHDTIEDCQDPQSLHNEIYNYISKEFGSNVANLVQELTKPEDVEKSVYYAKYATSSIEALVIKLADNICNVKDFNLTDYKKACVYFGVGSPIYEAFFARLGEIGQRFGHSTKSCMLDSYDELIFKLGHANVVLNKPRERK